MKGKYIFFAWAVTVVLGSLLFFPTVELIEWLQGTSYGATDWDPLGLLFGAWFPGMFAVVLSVPATALLWVALQYFDSRGTTGTPLLLNLLRCQLLLAALTFGWLYLSESDYHEFFPAMLLLYPPIGSLSLIGFFFRSQRRSTPDSYRGPA